MEKDYKPDGWLGPIGRTILYHAITSPDQIDSKMNGLLTDIKRRLGEEVDSIDGK